MKAIFKKAEEEFVKGLNLRNLDLSNVEKEKCDELRKIQKEHYDKYNFFKNLDKAINKKNKGSDNNV